MYGASSGQSVCESCAIGTYVDVVGSTICKNCSKFTYNALLGQSSISSCIDCSAGMYNHDPGQSSCNECEKGYYCVGNSSKVACPKGKYLNTTKSTSLDDCLDCSKGYYNDMISQSVCDRCSAV